MLALAVTLAIAAGPAAGAPGAQRTRVVAAVAPSRFACYSAQFSGFRPVTRTAADAWSGTVVLSISAPESICAPVPGDPTSYLTCFRIRAGGSRFVARTLSMVDDLARGSQRLYVYRLVSLCMPSTRVDAGGPSSPAKGMDHWTCYLATSSLSVTRDGVVVQDAFGRSEDTISAPLRLCAPAAFAGGRIVNRNLYATCYTDSSTTKGTPIVVRTVFGYLKAALGPRGTLCTASTLAR